MKWKDLDLVHRYVDGDLQDEEKDTFELLLGRDPSLQRYIEQVGAMDRTAKGLSVRKAPDIALPRGFWSFIRGLLPPLGPFAAGAAVATACLLLGLGAASYFRRVPDLPMRPASFRLVYYSPGAHSVSVLGDFNHWSGEIPLKPRGKKGYWLVELNVPPGEYRYVLLIDGEKRVADPTADYLINDDFGSKNSVVRIGI
ncbi:MAG: hypothetical protein GXP52_04410 [Deltaproteobacteria bacterium]|nr:hypothetical protein [Deltaproteobacteria bacterium]